MVDAGITTGDVAVLKVTPPERGEIVAVLESGQLVLRRYVVIAGIPHHLAENPARPDLTPAYDKPTHGVLWCLICTQPNGRSRSASPIKKVNYLREWMGGLESEFVAMLKPKLKNSPKAVLSPDSKGRGAKKKAAARKKSAGCNYGSATPPSGIGLNDTKGSDYCALGQGMICDEKPDRPYGQAYTDALARFSARAKQERDSREFDPEVLEAAERPRGSRKVSAEAAQCDPSR